VPARLRAAESGPLPSPCGPYSVRFMKPNGNHSRRSDDSSSVTILDSLANWCAAAEMTSWLASAT
jgi:hypothetical protein